jgi:membrane protease YdiL (CAAX protease family)
LQHLPPGTAVFQLALLCAWLALGVGVFATLGARVLSRGGRVSAREFGPPDLFLATAFIVWFGMNILKGFGGPEREVGEKEILGGAALFLSIVVVIAAFLYYRKINPFQQFGFFRRNVFECAGIAVGLMIAAFPLVLLMGKLTEVLLHGKTHPQTLVQYFLNASEQSDRRAVYLTMLLGVVVVPLAEETIFRGFLYGVLKRYAGPAGAALVTAGLFAAMHLNASALPALFVLALCFTLAYEATGSLLVTIFMHALFNFSMFLALLGVAAHSTPQ